jgi:hypothetical protein
MASVKERARWERAFEQISARMQRQRDSIVRLVQINTEAMAALEEIAAGGLSEDSAQDVAQRALDSIKGSAAPAQVESADSIEEATPIEDPRRNH